jgi:hypothetical protein
MVPVYAGQFRRLGWKVDVGGNLLGLYKCTVMCEE